MRNRINYRDLEKALLPFEVFRLSDIRKLYPGFDSRRLTEWQQKGYISMLIRGRYIFNDTKTDQHTLFLIANKLSSPSYVSLQSALSWFGLISEQAFEITSVTTQKTNAYETVKGHFSYNSIQENLFFGYQIWRKSGRPPVLIAEVERALIDLLYFNPQIDDPESMKALRLNVTALDKIDIKKMERYLRLFNNRRLNHRFNVLKNHFLC